MLLYLLGCGALTLGYVPDCLCDNDTGSFFLVAFPKAAPALWSKSKKNVDRTILLSDHRKTWFLQAILR